MGEGEWWCREKNYVRRLIILSHYGRPHKVARGSRDPLPNLVNFLILTVEIPNFWVFDPLDFQKCALPTLKNFLAAPMFPTPSLHGHSHQLYPIGKCPPTILGLATGL